MFWTSKIKASMEHSKGKYLLVYPNGKEVKCDLHGAFVACNAWYRLGKGNLECVYWSEKFSHWLNVRFNFGVHHWDVIYLRNRKPILERKHVYSSNFRDFR